MLVLSALIFSTTALAQDDAADAADEARTAAATTEEEIREIARGYYLKSDIGSTIYLLTYGGGLLSGVMTVDLAVGSDFIDNERNSVAWEVIFSQSLLNGVKFDQQPAIGLPANQYLQGDLHTFSGLAVVEPSIYPTRRFGVGVRVGGGVMYSPLLIEAEQYQTEVVGEAWGGVASSIDGGVMPVILVGPTIEYYTKLSHFSVGADIDAQYVIGLNDLGIVPKGYLKYTF